MQRAAGAESYVILLRDSVTSPALAARDLTGLFGSVPDRTYERAVKGFSAHLTEGAARALRNHPLVRHVERDALLSLSEVQSPAPWGLDRVDQRSRTNLSYSYDATGAGVTAYILDTGIRFDHSDFTVSATDLRSRASLGIDVVNDGRNGADCNGHGTHVSGTLGGRLHGVAKQVTLKVVRMFDCVGDGSVSGAIAGLDWIIADHQGGAPAVANLSINGDPSQALDDAVTRTIADGITVVVAAGNGAADACTSSPASLPSAITVGATTFDDSRSNFSNFGSCVDLYAPGHAIMSAGYGSTTSEVQYSGTSMAAPHVAGAAALYLSVHPSTAPNGVRDALVSQATQGIVTNASGVNNHLLYTAGIAGGVLPSTNLPPAAAFSVACSNLSCSFVDASTDADGTVQGWTWAFGDATGAGVKSTSHTFAAGGTYAVSLTVTDDKGATASVTQSVTVTASVATPPPTTAAIVLTGVQRTGRQQRLDLSWTGATSASVDVYRNGIRVTTTANDGAHSDNVGKRSGTYTHRVCAAGTSTCSNTLSTTF
ncbi:MAG: S8 family serine peptidase [Gemmatimonadota bacterium]